MKKNKYFTIIIIFIITLTNLFQIVYAAETVNEKIARLQKKYGISIVMDEAVFYENGTFKIVNSNVKGIPNEWIESLEKELKYIPTELNNYVVKNAGQPLTIRFLKMHKSMGDGFFDIGGRTALYTSGNNTIYIKFGMADSFVHEYGHMLDYYFFQNKKDFQSQWKKFNGSVPYGSDYDSLTEKQKNAYVRDYALTSIREDIAETFDLLAHGQSPYLDRKISGGLAKKLDYLENVIIDMVGKEGLFPERGSQTLSK